MGNAFNDMVMQRFKAQKEKERQALDPEIKKRFKVELINLIVSLKVDILLKVPAADVAESLMTQIDKLETNNKG